MGMLDLLASVTRVGDLVDRSACLDRLASLLGVEPHDLGGIEARVHGLLSLRDGVLEGEDGDALRVLAEDLDRHSLDDGWLEDLADARRHAADYRLHSIALAETDAALRGDDGHLLDPWPVDDDGCGQVVVDRAQDTRAEVERLRRTVTALRTQLVTLEAPEGWTRKEQGGRVLWQGPTAAVLIEAQTETTPLRIVSRGSALTIPQLSAVLRCETRQQQIQERD